MQEEPKGMADAIFCARGGYGSMRILSEIDYDAIKAHPKGQSI